MQYIKHKLLDPRTADWPLVHSPWNPVLIVGCYVYLSMNARNIMEKRRSYNLKTFLICYNAFLVLLSSYMVYEVSKVDTIVVMFSYKQFSFLQPTAFQVLRNGNDSK